MKRISGALGSFRVLTKRHKWIVPTIIAVIVVVAGAVVGGRKIYEHFHSGTVSVYSVEEVGMDPTYMEDDSSMEATVSTDQLQTEYLSSSETVSEIYVSKGQKVKEGDQLFSYDSTLNQISLKRKDIEIQKKKIKLKRAQKELAVIKTYRAGMPVPGSGSSSGGSGGSSGGSSGGTGGSSGGTGGSSGGSGGSSGTPTYPGLTLLGGNGTARRPYYYAWSDKFAFTKDFIAAAMQGKDEAYVMFLLSGSEIPDNIGGSTDDSSASDNTGDSSSDSNTDDKNNSDSESKDEDSVSVVATSLRSTPAISETGADSSTGVNQLPDGTQYFASWTMQFQKSGSGYRYVMLSMNVGGAERTISSPMTSKPSNNNDNNNNKNNKNKNNNNNKNDNNDNNDVDPPIDDNSDSTRRYTQAEINQLLADQTQKVKDLQLAIRQGELEYKKLKKECDDSVVRATVDGVVTVLRSPQKAGTDKPFIKISGDNAGYSIEGYANEFDLSEVAIGQTVTVTNQDSGETYEGKVKSVSRYPKQNVYFSGNPNTSYYPYKVAIDSYADFDLDSYVTISYGAQSDQQGGDSYYLPKAFVRTENGSSYVYIAKSDGTLEKRTVKTGKVYWGSYIQVIGGVSAKDKIAFPYGQNVRDGAQTTDGSTEDLYS